LHRCLLDDGSDLLVVGEDGPDTDTDTE